MKSSLALTIIVAAVLALALGLAQQAHGTASGDWYWTPANCKAVLTKGVETSDGRDFYPTKSFCIGQASTCAWSRDGSERLYQTFYAIMRSADGVVRSMYVNVTGKTTWSGSSLRLIFRYMGALQFATYTRVTATAYAEAENAKGCRTGVFGPTRTAGKPTAICNDGTYSYARLNVCVGHSGVLAVLP
jgi:hypothetical protein